jgi:hypothetical protein
MTIATEAKVSNQYLPHALQYGTNPSSPAAFVVSFVPQSGQ